MLVPAPGRVLAPAKISEGCSTERKHVIYESRPELSNLMLADFHPTVRHIVAQPFLLSASVDGHERRHIPDYLW
jgi:hypothetical protein